MNTSLSALQGSREDSINISKVDKNTAEGGSPEGAELPRAEDVRKILADGRRRFELSDEGEPGGQRPGEAGAGVKDVDGRGPGGVKELFAAGWGCSKIEDAAEAERCMREKVEEIKRMFKGTRPWYE